MEEALGRKVNLARIYRKETLKATLCALKGQSHIVHLSEKFSHTTNHTETQITATHRGQMVRKYPDVFTNPGRTLCSHCVA